MNVADISIIHESLKVRLRTVEWIIEARSEEMKMLSIRAPIYEQSKRYLRVLKERERSRKKAKSLREAIKSIKKLRDDFNRTFSFLGE